MDRKWPPREGTEAVAQEREPRSRPPHSYVISHSSPVGEAPTAAASQPYSRQIKFKSLSPTPTQLLLSASTATQWVTANESVVVSAEPHSKRPRPQVVRPGLLLLAGG